MKKLKNKTMAIMIAIFLMISMTGSMMLIPSVGAHNPAWQIPTYAYIQAVPSPIGVGQTVTIYMWLDLVYDNSALTSNYRFQGLKLTTVAPDGTTTTQTFTASDPTSNVYSEFTPTQVGTYNFTFNFPGQTITTSNDLSTSAYINDTYLPSSDSCTLTVQSAPEPILGSAPLPTNYWERPIYGENTYWYLISSNWLGNGERGYGLDQLATMVGPTEVVPGDAVGPATGHIMWTATLEAGGVVGGNSVAIPGDTYNEGSAYLSRFGNPIIMDGYLYYTEPVSFTGSSSGQTVCVDLRTGQMIWSSTQIPALSFGYIYDVQDPNQHGVFPPILFTSNFARAFDAYTGDPLFNVTGVPTGTTVLGPSGEQLRYVLANDGTPTNPQWYLAEWNSSRLWEMLDNPWTGAAVNTPTLYNDSFTNGTTLPVSDAMYANVTQPATGAVAGNDNNAPATNNYVVYGNVVNPSSSLYSYDWNISVPWLNVMGNQTVSTVTFSNGTTLLEQGYSATGANPDASNPTVVLAPFYGNMLLCMNGTYPGPSTSFTSLSWAPYTYFAVNLNASKGAIGSILWTNTLNALPGNLTVSFGGADPTVGVFTEYYRELLQWGGYSMTTGQKLWGPTGSETALSYYDYDSVPAGQNDQVAYGKLYEAGFSGIVYCYDLTNGNLLWTYGNGGSGNSTSSGGMTYPDGQYPLVINTIGNGIVYLIDAEHTVETPIYKGALARALNATTGQEIWTLSDDDDGGSATADGLAALFNGYDNSIYVVGQGPSATAVQAPMTAITAGTNVVIQGTVTDVSAGTQLATQKAGFPNGVPVASDASMADWMAYVYDQQPLPTNFTGVTVSIDAIDPNNNCIHIGTATTDAQGLYHYSWTPPNVAGDYTITASFAGTNSYYGSVSETAMTVTPATTAAPTAPPQANLATTADLMTYIVVAVVAIIIAIAIATLLMLRKHP
jgi:outer membrane protein assembly factor BamB